MGERIGNIGYFAMGKQTDAVTPAIPSVFAQLYDEDLTTDGHLQEQDPVTGQKFGTFNVLPGQRDHMGTMTVVAEPNTTGTIADAFMTKGTTTGPVNGAYTHPFTYSVTQNPNAYTLDVSTGNVVKRFIGAGVSSIALDKQDNELRWKLKISAIASFQGVEISTVSTTTLTLTSANNTTPSRGLVVGDLVRVYKSATGATLDTTIASVNADGVTVTLGASAAAFAAGDMLYLRPATVSFNSLSPFLWSNLEFRFGSTAAAALSATQTQLDDGSTFEIMHNFVNDEGEKRSGSFDPASLVRALGAASLSVKKFFDTPEDVQIYNGLSKRAVVIRMFAGLTRLYECRITMNNIKTPNPVASIKNGGEINYSEFDYIPQYDPTDGQALDIKVINGQSTI